MRRAWWLWWVLLVGCQDKAPADGALRVAVSYGSYIPGCVRVAVSDGQGHEASTDIVRSQFQPRDTRQLLIAVLRKPDWGRELTVEVSSHEGGSEQEGCSGKQVEVRGSDRPIPIPMKDYARFEVELRAQDADRDHFIKKEQGVEGTDCDDGRDDVYPGAPELCSVNVDFDCNGAKGCQEPACAQCTPPAGGCFTGSVCGGSGECVFTPVAEGTACDDQNLCTGNDRCGATGQCVGTSVACNTPPSGCYESLGTCNSSIGCSYTFKAAASSCDDAVACTVGDVCNGAGSCQGTQTPCTASSVCKKVTGGCTALNNCTEAPDPTKVNTGCMIDLSRTGVCRVQDGACSTFPYAPSNFNPDSIPQATIGTLTTTCTVTFDSETLLWTPPGCVSNPPQPVMMTQGSTEMVLLAMSTMNLGADLILRGSRPVILAVYGDVTLDRSILANGTIAGGTPVPGAGGNQGCTARKGGNGTLASGAGGGGGGAGGGTGGAAGANGSTSGALSGGAGMMGGSGFVPLEGGCPGGSGGGGAVEAGKPGAGGGAVQLSVARTLTLNQWITASGSGGGGGHTSTSNSQAGGGGGGGSGGQVLLEASKLNMAATARLTSNGGGGGEGGGYLNAGNQVTGEDGEDGARSSAAVAAGGSLNSFSGGNGGAGGAAAKAPVSGSLGVSSNGTKGGGGGGGGAVGFIRLRSLNPCAIDAAAVISPTTDKLCPL